MIEIFLRIQENDIGIVFKMRACNIDGPSTKLENAFGEKLCMKLHDAVLETYKELGLPDPVDKTPFQLVRRDKS